MGEPGAPPADPAAFLEGPRLELIQALFPHADVGPNPRGGHTMRLTLSLPGPAHERLLFGGQRPSRTLVTRARGGSRHGRPARGAGRSVLVGPMASGPGGRKTTRKRGGPTGGRRRAPSDSGLIQKVAEAIVESSDDGITSVTLDGIVRTWNPSAERIFGYRAEEIVGGHISILVPPDRAAEAAEILARVGRGEGVPHFETRRRRKDGAEIDVALTVSPIRDEAGNVVGASAIVREITQQKRAQEELRFQKALLEAQMEASMEGVLVVSRGGRIVSSTRRLREMWGIPEEVLASASDDAALGYVRDQLADPGEFLARVAHLYGHSDEEGRDEIRSRNGRVFDRFTAPLRSEDEVLGRIWFFRDVTELRRREEAQRFLSEAAKELATSLSLDKTLARVLRLAVPRLADWATVDLVDEDGSIRQLAVAHRDPSKAKWAREFRERFRPDPDARIGAPAVIRSGRPQLYPEIPESLIREAVRNAEARRMLLDLSLRSAMVVPLTARGRTLGP